jgi:hypothetical protein
VGLIRPVCVCVCVCVWGGGGGCGRGPLAGVRLLARSKRGETTRLRAWAAFFCREADLEMGQPRFYTLPPACVFVFCLHRHSLPPARVLFFVRRTSGICISHVLCKQSPGIYMPFSLLSASWVMGLSGLAVAPAPAPCAMHDTRRPRTRSRWVLGLRLAVSCCCCCCCVLCSV